MTDSMDAALMDAGRRWRDRIGPDPELGELLAVPAESRRPRRWIPVLAAAVVVGSVVVVTAIVHGAHDGRSAHRSDRVAGPALVRPDWKRSATSPSVRYPSGWHERTFPVLSSFSAGIVFLGNRPFSSPCHTTATSTECIGIPHTQLSPGGVVVGWYGGATLTGTRTNAGRLTHVPGSAITVAGLPAEISFGRPDSVCQAAGGTLSVLGVIAQKRPGASITMVACVDGDSAVIRAQLLASFRSITGIGPGG